MRAALLCALVLLSGCERFIQGPRDLVCEDSNGAETFRGTDFWHEDPDGEWHARRWHYHPSEREACHVEFPTYTKAGSSPARKP